MSSDNPPYPFYPGIPFNPSFFTSDSGSGLSEAQANAKYLRKTFPDTATALETFNAGIITPSISNTGTTDVNIKSGNDSTGTITIGQKNSLTKTTTTIKGDVNISSSDILSGSPLTQPIITIGKYNNDGINKTTTNIDGNVNIGFIGGDTKINTLYTDNIYGLTSDSLLDVGLGITTGDPSSNLAIRIGEYLTSGKIEIGKNQTSGSILLGSGNATTNTRNITIGKTTGAFDTNTIISGKTTINKLTLNAPITSAYTVVPISGQIGFIPTTIFNAGDATLFADNTSMSQFTNYSFAKIELTAGTWILVGSIQANSFATSGSVVASITPTQNAFSFTTDYYVQSVNNPSLNIGFLSTRIAQVTATQFYFLTARTTADLQVVTNYKLTATRIA
jgi:hypothetical protein